MKWNKRAARIMLTILIVALVGQETSQTIMRLLSQSRTTIQTKMNMYSFGMIGDTDPFTRTGRNSRNGRRGGRSGRRGNRSGRNGRRNGRYGGLLLNLDDDYGFMTVSVKDGKRLLELMFIEKNRFDGIIGRFADFEFKMISECDNQYEITVYVDDLEMV